MSNAGGFEKAFENICRSEAPLGARLKALREAYTAHEPEFADAYEQLVRRLEATGAARNTPQPGDPFPNFLLPDQLGHLVASEDLLEMGPLIVSFNRGHWCDYCELELRAFASAHSEIIRRGGQVVSIMPERQEFTKRLAERCGITFPILSDMDCEYALQLDLCLWLDERVSQMLRSTGIDLERAQGKSSWFIPVPATFVVAPSGQVTDRFVDVDFRNRMEIDVVLEALSKVSSGHIAQ